MDTKLSVRQQCAPVAKVANSLPSNTGTGESSSGVSVLGDAQNPPRQSPKQPALANPASSRKVSLDMLRRSSPGANRQSWTMDRNSKLKGQVHPRGY